MLRWIFRERTRRPAWGAIREVDRVNAATCVRPAATLLRFHGVTGDWMDELGVPKPELELVRS